MAVVTWGDGDCGGDSSKVQQRLRDVQQIQSSHSAFAALLGDGSVVCWGELAPYWTLAIQEQLKNVLHIQASDYAFAAIRVDGSVVTWGAEHFGGNSNAAQGQLKDVQHIQRRHAGFAAILADGSVVSWGA